MGRNSAFDHAGNIAIAVVAARSAMSSRSAPSSSRAVFGVLAGAAVLSIPAEAIDHDRARDLDREPDAAAAATGPPGYGVLFKSRSLSSSPMRHAVSLANAALLPLVGQKLAAAYPKEATAMMSACIVAAQAVMLPIALLVGRTADAWDGSPCFWPGSLSAYPCGALHALRQQLLVDRRPGARWRRRGYSRSHAPGDRRYHARYRTI